MKKDKYDWGAEPDKTLYERFEDNMGLVYNTLNRCFPLLCDDEDLYQEGCMGLWKAVQTYDPTIGIRFSTFAERVIRNHCIDYLRVLKSRTRVTEELSENIYDEDQYKLFDAAEDDFNIDLVAREIGDGLQGCPAAQRDIAIVARDRYLGKPSDVTCAEQGWKYRRYHERLMQLKKEMRRRKYTKL